MLYLKIESYYPCNILMGVWLGRWDLIGQYSPLTWQGEDFSAFIHNESG